MYSHGADAKIPSLKAISLDDLFTPLIAGNTEILAKQRDKIEPLAAHPSSVGQVIEGSSRTPTVAADIRKSWTPHMMIVPNNPYTRPLAELLKSD